MAKAQSQQVICKQACCCRNSGGDTNTHARPELPLPISLGPQHTHTHTPSNGIAFFQFPFSGRKKKKLLEPFSHLRASLYTPIHDTLQKSSLPLLSSLSFAPSFLLPLLSCPVPVTVNSTPCTHTHTRKPQRDTNITNTQRREPTLAAEEEE